MKINENQRIGSINKYKQTSESRSVSGTDKKKLKDEVQISTEAKELLGNASAVRSSEQNQRIEELKESVSSGTYHVEAGKIAEKLFPYIK